MNKNDFAKIPRWAGTAGTAMGHRNRKRIETKCRLYGRALKQYGWEYVVCDIQWYEPTADSSHYHKFADLCMDEYGR